MLIPTITLVALSDILYPQPILTPPLPNPNNTVLFPTALVGQPGTKTSSVVASLFQFPFTSVITPKQALWSYIRQPRSAISFYLSQYSTSLPPLVNLPYAGISTTPPSLV